VSKQPTAEELSAWLVDHPHWRWFPGQRVIDPHSGVAGRLVEVEFPWTTDPMVRWEGGGVSNFEGYQQVDLEDPTTGWSMARLLPDRAIINKTERQVLVSVPRGTCVGAKHVGMAIGLYLRLLWSKEDGNT